MDARRLGRSSLVATLIFWIAPAQGVHAQDDVIEDPEAGLVETAPPEPVDDEPFAADEPEPEADEAEDAGGAFLLGGKLGGGVPLSGLDASIAAAIELGYLFRRTDPSFGVFLDVSYFVPEAEGTSTDGRLASNRTEYDWHVWQKELVFQPSFLYRLTLLHDFVVPYAAIGPRLYLLETVAEGDAGGASFPTSKERSTKLGFGIPIGVELAVGPGGLIGELLFQWGPLPHDITGDTNVASASFWLGYRALL